MKIKFKLLLLLPLLFLVGCSTRPSSPLPDAEHLQELVSHASDSNDQTVGHLAVASIAVDHATTNPSALEEASSALTAAGGSAAQTSVILKDAKTASVDVVKGVKKLDQYTTGVVLKNQKLESEWLSPKMKGVAFLLSFLAIVSAGLWVYFKFFTAVGPAETLLGRLLARKPTEEVPYGNSSH